MGCFPVNSKQESEKAVRAFCERQGGAVMKTVASGHKAEGDVGDQGDLMVRSESFESIFSSEPMVEKHPVGMCRLVEQGATQIIASRRDATVPKGRIPMGCEDGGGYGFLPSVASLRDAKAYCASSRAVVMCKAYSLDFVVCPIRRALPYANMRKGFALKRRCANMRKGFALKKGVRALPYTNMRKGFALKRRCANMCKGFALKGRCSTLMCQGFALPKGAR